MQIRKNSVVTFHYTLTDDKGTQLDSSSGKDPLAYLHGAGNIIPGLERELEGKSRGDALKVEIAAADGYGEIQQYLIQEVPRSAFDGIEEVAVGMQFQADSDRGPVTVTVTAMNDDTITVDGNHPLAGKTLHFQVSIESVRTATSEELAHGHVHGPGGHHH